MSKLRRPGCVAQVIDMWTGEKASYNYGPVGSSCTSKEQGAATGEFTQMVWSGTEKMGCGMASCGEKGTVWVCHFFPAGNVVGEAPFCANMMEEGMERCPGAMEAQPKSCGGDEPHGGLETHASVAGLPSPHGDAGAPVEAHAEEGHKEEEEAQHLDAVVVVEG